MGLRGCERQQRRERGGEASTRTFHHILPSYFLAGFIPETAPRRRASTAYESLLPDRVARGVDHLLRRLEHVLDHGLQRLAVDG